MRMKQLRTLFIIQSIAIPHRIDKPHAIRMSDSGIISQATGLLCPRIIQFRNILERIAFNLMKRKTYLSQMK